jgi:tetratricopeptide (TPR) repeat protein
MLMEQRFTEALSLLADADAHFRQLNNVSDRQWCLTLATLSLTQLESGDAAKAVTTAGLALELADKAFPKDNYLRALPLLALGRADLAEGRSLAAEQLLQRALAVSSPPRSTSDLRILEIEVSIYEALRTNGKEDEARAVQRSLLPLLRMSPTPYAKKLQARLTNR